MNPTYQRRWVDAEGKQYRQSAYDRQKANGLKPLIDNPTIDEIKETLREFNPKKVLEVGCGWGRLLTQLNGEFNIEGCDVSDDMLALVPKGIKTFKFDIAVPHYKADMLWDVIFTRGVLHYLLDVDDERLLGTAAMNLSLMGNRVILWELPEVCEAVKVFGHPGFIYKPIIQKAE